MKPIRLSLLAAAALGLTGLVSVMTASLATSLAQGAIDEEQAASVGLGPEVGAPIPHDLSATDAFGAARAFDDLTGENGAAVFFVRSVEWCPFCQAQVMDIDAQAEAFAARGLTVVFVSYDAQDKQRQFIERRSVSSVLLSDSDRAIIDAFDLRDPQYKEGSRAYGVPYPAVFIVNTNKEIAAKLYEADYKSDPKSYRRRPAADIILDAADAAKADGRL